MSFITPKTNILVMNHKVESVIICDFYFRMARLKIFSQT